MWERPTEPTVLNQARDRLYDDLAAAWRHKRSRGVDLDPVLPPCWR
ncbi:hypothetical protein ACPCG0_02675 [Propionibacteriaceae bacterium Y1923]